MTIHRSSDPYVYFIGQADDVGPIKIGCSQAPEDRLCALMCWSPYRLKILATLPGDEVLERRFHALFASEHSHREWFNRSPALLAVINDVAGGEFDTETLPAAKRLSYPRQQCSVSRHRMGNLIRLNAVARWGFPIPRDVYEATRGRHRDEADSAARAALIQEFLDTHYAEAAALKKRKAA